MYGATVFRAAIHAEERSHRDAVTSSWQQLVWCWQLTWNPKCAEFVFFCFVWLLSAHMGETDSLNDSLPTSDAPVAFEFMTQSPFSLWVPAICVTFTAAQRTPFRQHTRAILSVVMAAKNSVHLRSLGCLQFQRATQREHSEKYEIPMNERRARMACVCVCLCFWDWVTNK